MGGDGRGISPQNAITVASTSNRSTSPKACVKGPAGAVKEFRAFARPLHHAALNTSELDLPKNSSG